jgi:hypothetical protein
MWATIFGINTTVRLLLSEILLGGAENCVPINYLIVDLFEGDLYQVLAKIKPF